MKYLGLWPPGLWKFFWKICETLRPPPAYLMYVPLCIFGMVFTEVKLRVDGFVIFKFWANYILSYFHFVIVKFQTKPIRKNDGLESTVTNSTFSTKILLLYVFWSVIFLPISISYTGGLRGRCWLSMKDQKHFLSWNCFIWNRSTLSKYKLKVLVMKDLVILSSNYKWLLFFMLSWNMCFIRNVSLYESKIWGK